MTQGFLDRLRSRRAALAQGPVFDGLAQMRAYWEALRKHDQLPRRAEIDPRGLSGILDRAFLAERIGRGLAQIRIGGSSLAEFAGTDLRGLPLSCLFAADSRPLLAQSVERVFSEPALAEIDLGSDRGAVGTPVARLLLLPLAEAYGTHTLMGAVSFAKDQTGPCKFQLLARREETLTPSPVLALHAGLATSTTGTAPVRRGHLTLVHFNG